MLFAMLYDTKNDAPSLCDIIASCSEAVVAADNETPSGGVTLTHDDPCQGLVLTIPSHIPSATHIYSSKSKTKPV